MSETAGGQRTWARTSRARSFIRYDQLLTMLTFDMFNCSYKRVKGRSHTVEKRKASHPQKPHATSQPSRFSHTPRLSTDAAHVQLYIMMLSSRDDTLAMSLTWRCLSSTGARHDHTVGMSYQDVVGPRAGVRRPAAAGVSVMHAWYSCGACMVQLRCLCAWVALAGSMLKHNDWVCRECDFVQDATLWCCPFSRFVYHSYGHRRGGMVVTEEC